MTSNSHIIAGLLCKAGILCIKTTRAADYPIETVPGRHVEVKDGFRLHSPIARGAIVGMMK